MATPPTALTGKVGEKLVVKSATYDAYGMPSTSPVTWSTSDSTIATVQNIIDYPGAVLVFCIKTGSATITATANSNTADFDLTVVSGAAGPAEAIVVSADKSFQPH